MEEVRKILQDSVSGGFWNFIGYWILIGTALTVVTTLIVFIINRPLRHWNIRIHGYPPQHCDADGDFKKEE